ncbi:MAG: hypothetical protein JO093_07825 [Acidobacteria bacterium]|nr:hypothetical protein [Acidobacteriota bacterium]MBV9068211.1 hypothetical protein [Acidobacteriota bacterium]MBV9185514.1 hypothetical protein [Acidobacteriota bacterium]
MLDEERQYFSEHGDELRRQHPGKFVIIHGQTVAGAFATQEEALGFGAREFGLSSFLVRNVEQRADIEVTVPALALGLLRADPSHPVRD